MAATANPKIIDIISQEKEDGKPYISLEYFPPRTEEGVKVRERPLKGSKEQTSELQPFRGLPYLLHMVLYAFQVSIEASPQPASLSHACYIT